MLSTSSGKRTGGGGKLATREERRRALAREVTHALRHQDFRTSLAVTTSDDVRPVIPALPDDTVGIVFRELEKYDQGANIVTSTDHGLAIIHFMRVIGPQSADGPVQAAHDDDACPIHRSTEIGMLLTYLRTQHAPVRCHLLAPGCELELVDDGSDLHVPA